MPLITNAWRRVNYTLLAPFYDRMVGGFAAARRRSIELAQLQPGEKVLIVGAGTGLDLEYLPPGVEVFASDLTPAMLRRLQQRAAALPREVHTQIADAQALPYADGAFDAVLVHLILAVVPDARRCAEEVVRVARPGGRIAIFDKFAPPTGLPWWMKLASPLVAAGGTTLTRPFAPMFAGLPVKVVHDEPAMMRGLFRVMRLEVAGEKSGERPRAAS